MDSKLEKPVQEKVFLTRIKIKNQVRRKRIFRQDQLVEQIQDDGKICQEKGSQAGLQIQESTNSIGSPAVSRTARLQQKQAKILSQQVETFNNQDKDEIIVMNISPLTNKRHQSFLSCRRRSSLTFKGQNNAQSQSDNNFNNQISPKKIQLINSQKLRNHDRMVQFEKEIDFFIGRLYQEIELQQQSTKKSVFKLYKQLAHLDKQSNANFNVKGQAKMFNFIQKNRQYEYKQEVLQEMRNRQSFAFTSTIYHKN